jgi:hypothetical protein
MTSTTTTSTPTTTPQVVQDLQNALNSLTSLAGTNSVDTLKAAWNYLQVYSTWCERLPSDQATLNATLSITNPGAYDFYNSMLTSYQSTSGAGAYFLNNVFPAVVNLGNDLQNFATTAGDAPGNQGIFSIIQQQLDSITPTTPQADAQNILQNTVLPLLSQLQTMAQQNETNAQSVATQLSTYKSQLTAAQSQLGTTDSAVAKDASVSQATINTLSGGPTVTGSIQQLEALKQSEQSTYQQDVTIACTTLTYAWVCFGVIPVGLITAAVVAGVYGSRATAMLKQIHQTEDELSTAEAELQTAIAVHGVQSTAKQGLDSALNYTTVAITQTTTVQNNWNTISSNLGDIQTKLQNTTYGQGSDQHAENKMIINIWLNQARLHWNTMIPLMNALTANPYITVLPGNTSASTLLNQQSS